MLDAVSFALQIPPYSHIVGFRDASSGLVITPSILCNAPEKINLTETFEVMIRQTN